MARVSKFTKIDGYKHIIKCSICGKKSTSEKNAIYCKECLERMKKEQEDFQRQQEKNA